MGSSASAPSETPGGDLRLPNSGLRFSLQQLRYLNSYIDVLCEEDHKGRMSTETESAVESLVQRIVDGAGQRDPRFRCCHLIALHRGKKMRSRSLEYLVTLDSLPVLNSSDHSCLQDGPVGYGKVRLTGKDADKWAEFLTPAGYLCRDKVLERWVELIARCAGGRGGGGSRVLSAAAHHTAKPYQYCYLERATTPQTPSERRLAIVEGTAWVMVRVGASQAEAKLMLGARVQGCSPTAITTTFPLTHPLALLHYTSAQQGYYAVAIGPPVSVSCGERAATWQLWSPAHEAALDAHCADAAAVSRLASAFNALIDRMRDGCYQVPLRLLSRYTASCALRRRLQASARAATAAARAVVAAHASHHLLLVLDSLMSSREGGQRGYVWGGAGGARRGARGEASTDSAVIMACLQNLHNAPGEDVPPSPSESLEMAMFNRWEGVIRESKAASGSNANFCRRQLNYLWRVSNELVQCKRMISYENHSTFRANLLQVTSLHQERVEDLIHILAIMLDQARDLYLNNFKSKTFNEFDREMTIYRSKKWNKLKEYYDASSACLIDAVRRDPELRAKDLDGITTMKAILAWLHKGAKDDKKYLGPVLKPYLDGLYNSSLENSWFLEDFDQKRSGVELEGLKEFCEGVHDGSVDPCLGLLAAAKKQAWAKATVDFVDRFRHVDFRLVFPTGDGMAISFPMKLPSRREHSSARTLTLSRRDKAEAKIRLARRCVLGAFASALVGDGRPRIKQIGHHLSTDEILSSVKSGNFWRNSTKPDVIPSTSNQTSPTGTLDNLPKARRRSRKKRPVSSSGFPEISISDQSDKKTMRRKYHTLRSLVYTEQVETVKELRQRPRSAGSTVRNKEPVSRPSLLETLDFINSVKDALCVEESGTSDVEDAGWGLEEEWLVGQAAPLNLLAARAQNLHLTLGDVTHALLNRGNFTVLQELCGYLGAASDGALFALHRLARAARSRSSDRSSTSSWRLPAIPGESSEPIQRYNPRPPDYMSGDEGPQPPPLPRRNNQITKKYTDYLPPKRMQDLEHNLNQLELMNSKLNLHQSYRQETPYTGVINPLYDIKIPKDRFQVKRSKSLGRSFSTRKVGLEISRYNLTLGHRSGKTNDVVTAITGTTGETGLDGRSHFFQRNSGAVVGDTYRISKVSVD